jgi:hypothetical protein
VLGDFVVAAGRYIVAAAMAVDESAGMAFLHHAVEVFGS